MEPYKTDVYKQTPGADIDPGWYAVRLNNGWPPGPTGPYDGPYPTKRAALAAARRIAKAPIPSWWWPT